MVLERSPVMQKFRKLRQLEKRRERTLNVSLPHVIKDKKDVENLFVGDFQVKLPRQSSRSCHVVFPNVEEKLKNYKLAKDKTINGKRIVIQPLHAIVLDKKIKKVKKKKKIYIPEIKPDLEVTQTIFISNIINGTKSHELKGALPGCISVTLLKSYNQNCRSAIAKMENIQIAAEYLKRKSKWPTLNGHKLYLKPDTRTKHKKKITKKTTDTLKIHNENKTEESQVNSDYIEDNNESD